jgi:hypothetical protein
MQFSHSVAGTYPQRRYEYVATLSNSSLTNLTLYLLDTDYGLTSSYTVVTAGGSPIEDAKLTFQRYISGVLTTVTEGYTDSSGVFTAFLNPNYPHTITVSADGYDSLITTIYPTQAMYTFTLGGGSSATLDPKILEGVMWSIKPASGIVQSGIYNYSFEVYSYNTSAVYISSCYFNIRLPNGTIVATATGCAGGLGAGGYISTLFDHDSVSGKRWIGQYYITTPNGTISIETDAQWIRYNLSARNYGMTILDAINSSIYLPEWGDDDETPTDFNRIVFFFLIMAVLLVVTNRFTPYDVTKPGWALVGMTMIVIFLSGINGLAGPGYFFMPGAFNVGSFCTGTHAGTWCGILQIADNWALALHFLLLCVIVICTITRREQA